MLSNTVGPTEKVANTPEELAALIELRIDAEVREQLSVPKSFKDKFIAELEGEVARLATSSEGILVREFREDLTRLITTFRAVARNCRNDPQDVDEELALPAIVREIADAAEEYATHVSRPSGRERHGPALAAIEKDIKEVRLPWARRLLDRMTANDELPAAQRLSLSTAFFEKS